jgi:hypothetical protein
VTGHVFDLAITGDIIFGGHVLQGGTLLVDGEHIAGISTHAESIQRNK